MGTDTYLQLTTFAFILMRMTGLVITNPFLGRNGIPTIFRAGEILAFTVFIYSYTDAYVAPINSFPEYVLLLIKEFMVGVAISLVVNFFSYIITFAGEISDMQAGLSMSAVYDPGNNLSMSSIGNYYNIMYIMIFFTTNAHLTMLRLFLDSGQVIPYGEVVINTQLTDVILDIFCQCTVLGLKMALPLVFMELMVEIAVGTIMKAVPQIDIFVINIQMKLVIGIFFIFLTFQPMAAFIQGVVTTMFTSIEQVMSVM